MLGLRFCARASCSCGERGPLFIAVRGPLTVAASLVAEHRLQTRRLSNCGSRAQLLCGMWDPPRPGREPASPVLFLMTLTVLSLIMRKTSDKSQSRGGHSTEYLTNRPQNCQGHTSFFV